LPTKIVNPDIVPLLTKVKSYPRTLQPPPISRLMHSIFQATMGRPEISIQEKMSEALLVMHQGLNSSKYCP
jgi:hypothetical protein